MFGYVTPCKMELKIKDYEKFKAYYCGLCRSIKTTIGNIPRAALNYDMTFLAILLDSLNDDIPIYSKKVCAMHGFRKKISIIDNQSLEYAAFCNTALSYYKFVDNINDDNSTKSKIFSLLFKRYLNKMSSNFRSHLNYIENTLNELYKIESNPQNRSIDEISHPFGELTGFILSAYRNDENKENLYWLGYNLGKWIYIIDGWDDLERDMRDKKFNVINSCFNKGKKSYIEFSKEIEDRIDFILGTSAAQCMYYLNKLPLKKNEDLLYNILQFGLLEKMDKVFKRGVCKNERSI
ncbi:DUF5685 family protein [Clostridium sp. CX1]|uniref:DUF5685 family protein n=1 Tax=Clostridium sp. CX1 TaxID=2978346 RepID=UPI0021C00EDC|nr:DUF5685 family protein [Clostridium sp. CX1]MCT8975852.1 DUF5685 family protein [Clostridium sp. CX1]